MTAWPLCQPTTRCESWHFSTQILSLDHRSSNITTYCRLAWDQGEGGASSSGPRAPLSRLDCSRPRVRDAESCPLTRLKLPEGWPAYNSSCKAPWESFQFIRVQSRRGSSKCADGEPITELVSELTVSSARCIEFDMGDECSETQDGHSFAKRFRIGNIRCLLICRRATTST
jgi:hypothetical protein